METKLFGRCKKHIHTYFGRSIKSPSIVIYFKYIHKRGHLTVVSTQLNGCIRFELTFAVETVAERCTKRQLKYRMLLIGSYRRRIAKINRFTTNMFVIRTVSDKQTYRNIRTYIVTSFEVSTPTARLIGKAIA